MLNKKLREYLDSHKVKYVAISHTPAYTAQEIAARAHIPGHELAKTIVLKADGKFIMVVLPSDYLVDLERMRHLLNAGKVEFANEEEFKYAFPDCEIGAMPPFGNLYDMDTYVAESLRDDDRIAFNGGNHKDLIQINYEDYIKLVHPRVLRFSRKVH